MAFSFRAGTNWCHDFPKLARESGFYFSMHGSKVRVDWNRISTLDIDRVIRERDFSTIDENINNVIDYCLESEYDVKILDANFVKLFRLAQLSVEYLLYCKQYLDHSVIILKDELRQKIEHNVSTKKEIAILEDTIKNLKERSKEKCKFIETRVGDSSGEIYKCPHCPKTFVSATFVNAHVARRHSYISDIRVVTSPVHDHYRAVTEKLHNEIKTLKERLNQTERVIRNESDKFLDNTEKNFVRNMSENECDVVKVDEFREQRRYREDIENLRSILFDEIRKLRRKEHTVDDNSVLEANVKALIGQQEKELDSLKSQLLERLTPGIENMQMKLQTQENYWKAKIEYMEVQHHEDIEKLITELKITQRAADRIKSEYASKMRDLEKQSLDQSNVLVEQGKRLNCLSREISNSQARANSYETKEKGTMIKRFHESPLLKVKHDSVASCNDNDETHRMILSSLENSEIVIEDVGSESSQEHSDKSVPIAAQSRCTLDKKDAAKVRDTERFIADFDATVRHAARSNSKNSEILEIITETKDKAKRYDALKNFDKTNDHARQIFSVKDVQDVSVNITKKNTDVKGAERREASRTEDARNDKKSTFLNERNPDSPTESEFSSTSRSESENESITADDDDVTVKEYATHVAKSLDARRASMREDAQSMLDNRLRDLGIDPEWHGIPMTTFRQKMEIVRHQRNINAKKWIRYSRIKRKIIADIFRRISTNRIEKSGHATFTNESPLDKLITRVKSKSSKAFGGHKSSDEYSSVQKTMSEKTTSSKLHLKQKIELLPQKYKDNESSLKRNRTDLCTSPKTVTTQSRLITDCDGSADRDTCSATSVNSPKRVKQISSTKIIVSDSNVHKVNSPIGKKRMEEMVVPKFSGNNDDTSGNNDDTSGTTARQDSVVFSKNRESRSALKPTSGSLSSLVKKKVLFDLQDERNDATISENDGRKDQESESDWLVSSLPEERENTLQRDKFMSTGNIVLRTSQSDKIAEISKKIQEQLNTVRRPPVGSIETIFKSDVSLQSLTSHSAGKLFNSTSLGNSILEGPVQNFASPKMKNGVPLPQLVLRTRKDQDSTDARRENEFSVFKYTDLDSDIDEILQME